MFWLGIPRMGSGIWRDLSPWLRVHVLLTWNLWIDCIDHSITNIMDKYSSFNAYSCNMRTRPYVMLMIGPLYATCFSMSLWTCLLKSEFCITNLQLKGSVLLRSPHLQESKCWVKIINAIFIEWMKILFLGCHAWSSLL